MTFEGLIWTVAGLFMAWRIAMPVERCPVKVENLIHYVTRRWSPWGPACGWSSQVDATATAIQMALVVLVAFALVKLARDRRARA